jgi:hypothetical protein
VLVGNKCDLANERVVETSEGASLASQWKCAFFETSARMKINNETCFFGESAEENAPDLVLESVSYGLPTVRCLC